jgi:hypothetical protein
MNAWEPRRRVAHPPEDLDGSAQVDGGSGHKTVAAGVPEGVAGRLLRQPFAMVAEFEADLGRLRIREGMALAKRQGKLKGKQPELPESAQRSNRRRYATGRSLPRGAGHRVPHQRSGGPAPYCSVGR